MYYVPLQFKRPTPEWATLAHPLESAIVTSASRLWLGVKLMRAAYHTSNYTFEQC